MAFIGVYFYNRFTEILMNLVYHDNIDLQRIKSAIHRKTLFFLNNVSLLLFESLRLRINSVAFQIIHLYFETFFSWNVNLTNL